MKSVRTTILAAVLTLSVASAAQATFTGQIWIPSTDAKGFGDVNISIDNYIRMTNKADAGANYYNAGVTVGVLPFEKFKMEVGVDYLTDNLNNSSSSTSAAHPIYFNFKGAIPEDAFFKGMPSIAAGMFGLNTASVALSSNTAYGLIAKTFPVVGRISLGGYNGSQNSYPSKHNNGLLASWDRTMSEISDKLWVAVDYASGNNALGALSVGASWAFTPNVSLLVGANFYNPFYNPQGGALPGGKPTITTQLDINF
jgi:hypothetical protein